ncbi:hypothetical protein KC351_g80 [Hortaea werneckii]|nr:hypothetical protein KC351_g80 [Hortaea werneckii]
MRPVIPVHEAFINSQSLNLILDRLSTTLACSTQRRCIHRDPVALLDLFNLGAHAGVRIAPTVFNPPDAEPLFLEIAYRVTTIIQFPVADLQELKVSQLLFVNVFIAFKDIPHDLSFGKIYCAHFDLSFSIRCCSLVEHK